ncbi:hypothetical protein HU200_023734 [Digitaria exilis]|uniref:Glycosyltransferase 2-like domain-containing protein n=2 Tax=PACMAD clade TaxID=147370 RepID=A0A835EWL2_9POAL|nr:hypothetical protein HU200_023734 [Digitaria exilis]
MKYVHQRSYRGLKCTYETILDHQGTFFFLSFALCTYWHSKPNGAFHGGGGGGASWQLSLDVLAPLPRVAAAHATAPPSKDHSYHRHHPPPRPFKTHPKKAHAARAASTRAHPPTHTPLPSGFRFHSVRSKQGTTTARIPMPALSAAAAAAATAAAAWALRAAVWACLAASAMLVAEAAYMGLASLAAAASLWRRPERRYRWEPMPGGGSDGDVEADPTAAEFPMVLVQIPMYNEREVYKLSIGAACALTWPPDRIIIQVLDDSTDPIIKFAFISRVFFSIVGMFLTWPLPGDFAVNYDVCLMTRIQKMSLDYHFKVEQESGSFVYSFFGFNGTAGVWRVSAINQSGGWKDRTTVEDMDLAVRANLKGWEFLSRVNFQVPSKPTDINSIGGLVALPISSGKWLGKSLQTRSLHLMPFWILFENVMSMHRMRAALTGLLETARANDWVVTEKVGDLAKDDLDVPLLEPLKPTECVERIYIPELLLAMYLLICASYDFFLGSHKYYLYIYLQAFAYVVIGFGFVGTRTPCS